MTFGSGYRSGRGAESPRARRLSLVTFAVLVCLVAVGPMTAVAATAGAGPGGATGDASPAASTADASSDAPTVDPAPGTRTTAVDEPTIATESVRGASTADEPVAVRYDVDLRPDDPDLLEVEIRVTIPDDADVEHLGFYPYGEEWEMDYEVLASDGIEKRPYSDALWMDTSHPEPSVRIEFDPTVSRSSGYDHLVTDEWAFVRLRTDYDGEAPLAETVEPEGVKGTEYLYVGEYETHERDAYGQRLRLVVPDDAEMAEDPADVLDSLAYGSRHLRVGERNEELNAFVGPSPPIRTGGAAPWTNRDFWVSEGSTLYSNSWAHEYVHTRQNYGSSTEVRTDRSRWRIEAEARYYQYLLAYEQGHLDRGAGSDAAFEEFRERLAIEPDEHDGVELAEPDTWGTSSNYEKGALVVAALDAELRERTDGESTYQDVMRRLNEEGGGHDALVDATEAVAGEPLDDFLARYVTGTEIPTVPDDASLYERGDREVDVEFDLEASFESDASGEEAIVPGETGALSYVLTNEGADASVAPEATVDLPDGWEVVAVETDPSGSTDWTATDETSSTAELPPGDGVEVRLTVRAPADATGAEELRVTVDDADGYAAADSVAVSDLEEPTAALAVDDVAIEGEPIHLDAGESRGDVPIATYRWDLTGDGEVDVETDEPALEYTFEPDEREVAGPDDHETIGSGEREVSVTVIDEHGLADAATVSVAVTDVPTVETDAERVVAVDEPAILEAAVANEVGETAVTWELPDGSVLDGDAVEHRFAVGVHDLVVRAVDEYGAEAAETVRIVANDDPAIEVEAPEVIDADESAALAASVENEVGETAVTWELPDGSTRAGDAVEVTLEPGEREIRAVVEDEFGARSTETVAVTVERPADDRESTADDEPTTDADPSASDDGAAPTAASDGQPGFGAVSTIAVLLALAAFVVRRR